MADKMLIDATHPEEIRVVVMRGNRVEEFDFESASRKPLRGNIYLAKVTRVEPSLQAAFVDYGGNRHGFLAFSEIHPDYYQIPVADRQALLDEEERAQRDADAEADNRSNRRSGRPRRRGANRRTDVKRSKAIPVEEPAAEAAEVPAGEKNFASQTMVEEAAATDETLQPAPEQPVLRAEEAVHEANFPPAREKTEAASAAEVELEAAPKPKGGQSANTGEPTLEPPLLEAAAAPEAQEAAEIEEHGEHEEESHSAEEPRAEATSAAEPNGNSEEREEEVVESVGGADALEEVQERLSRFRRQYKIQEVIKRRQVMLVQVVKEERGSKGAALTTYLSLAGRYSVLMPNTARGGGISRKITNAEDRGRLKEIAQELDVPQGMGVILRTAGASRTKTEVKRDFEYLLRLWEQVRDLTLRSTAPTLVYEEGSLIKRSIRDLYSKDIEEIMVSGEDGHKEAREFMRMLMPSHAKNVKLYKDTPPLFTRYGIESQLDAMFSPVVQLRSGGYVVINQAEALVAIDVNSGRATREHHIEDTALKTNVEAAEEIARQLRLRDLAGLIVIDFIDMDETRNNRSVERRLKDALKHDRARIQVGRISHFGLLEMSRQRIRSSVLESSTEKCPICGGSGHVRSVSSVALQLVRAIEEMLIKGATHNLIVRTRAEVALYVLNHKRAHLRELEERFRVTLTISADATLTGQQSFIIDRGEQVHSLEAARSLAQATPMLVEPETATGEESESMAESTTDEAEGEGEREGGGRRRRRRRGGGHGRSGERREGASSFTHETVAEHTVTHENHDGNYDGGTTEEKRVDEPLSAFSDSAGPLSTTSGERESRRRRRRGRRGGRRNRRTGNGDMPLPNGDGAAEPELQQAVADLDRPPAAADADNGAHDLSAAPSAEAPSEFSRPPAERKAVAVAEPELEVPRRRSTIREPAPIPAADSPPPPAPSATPPQPVISISSSDETAEPKRGWWGRRILGDKR